MRIEDVHEYLDKVEDVISFLNETANETVSFEEIDGLLEVVRALHGWKTAYGGGPQLGISHSVLNRYVKFNEEYQTREAKIVAQRVRSFLRGQDQATSAREEMPHIEPPHQAVPTEESSSCKEKGTAERLTVRGEGWQIVGTSPDIKIKINALSMLLEEVVLRARGTNAPPEQQALTQLERAQLITLLETALAVLKAPMVETGLLKKVGKALGRLVKKVAEKEVEEGLGSLADMATGEIADVLSHLPDQLSGP